MSKSSAAAAAAAEDLPYLSVIEIPAAGTSENY